MTTRKKPVAPPVETPVAKTKRADVPVSAKLAATIRKMDRLMVEEFDTDYAYAIMGGGGTVAASNERDGVVPPVEKS